MATLNGYPIFKAELSPETEGLFAVSFVDDPAMEVPFLAFDREKEPMLFSVENEEQRRVLGCIIRADFPILRRDSKGGYFYVTFSKEVIREIARRYVENGYTSNFDLQHDHDRIVDGIRLEELFVKDTQRGINPVGFDVEEGSLFACYKILNPTVWEQIKKGDFGGLSMEAIVTLTPKEEPTIETIEDLLDYLTK